MASPAAATSCAIGVEVYSGTRDLFPPGSQIHYRVFDGDNTLIQDTFQSPAWRLAGLPFHDNSVDNYTVVVTFSGYGTSGFQPIAVSPSSNPIVRLMLLPNKPVFDFTDAQWAALQQNEPRIWNVISGQAGNPPIPNPAQQKYVSLMASNQKSAACMLNILTAMDQISLGGTNTPLDFIKEIRWDAGDFNQSPQQDRFYCWADKSLIAAIIEAGDLFAAEPQPSAFHGGTASRSWKEAEYGEANVQFTFHESIVHPDHPDWVQLEPDIDYYKDLLSHFLLEVAVNWFGSLTEPTQVYMLRFNDGNKPGKPPFAPPYVIRSTQ